jgi:multidrug efflux pump subunit AcrB
MSVGVATSNSILVVSFARERLEAGETPEQAALDAGFVRFRPVLMTALAMTIGMVCSRHGLTAKSDGSRRSRCSTTYRL